MHTKVYIPYTHDCTHMLKYSKHNYTCAYTSACMDTQRYTAQCLMCMHTTPNHTILYDTIPHHTTPHHTTPHHTSPHLTTHHTTPHHTTPHHTTPYHTIPHHTNHCMVCMVLHIHTDPFIYYIVSLDFLLWPG